MKPEELLDPSKYPEDLRWLLERFQLPPHDPVFLLLAWHHQKVAGLEQGLKLKTLELKAALDLRAERMEKATGSVQPLTELIPALQQALAQKPLALTKQIDAELKTPIAEAVQKLQALDHSLDGSLREAKEALSAVGQRQVLAGLMAGFAAGLLLATLYWLP